MMSEKAPKTEATGVLDYLENALKAFEGRLDQLNAERVKLCDSLQAIDRERDRLFAEIDDFNRTVRAFRVRKLGYLVFKVEDEADKLIPKENK